MAKLSKEILDARKQACNINTYIHSRYVIELLNHIDAIEQEKQRLIDNVAQLQVELQQEHESKKVVLPKDAIDALEYLTSQYSVRNIMALLTSGRLIGGGINRSYDDKRADAVSVLNDYEFEDILIALTFGYTIEEPPTVESQIKATIEAELKRQGITSPAPIDYVAKCLTDLISPIVVKDALQHDLG